jgi:hypothetical protein
MNTLKVLAAIAALCVLFTYTSCTGGGTVFRTHQDSMAFAKTYFDKYPEENSVKTVFNSVDSIAMKGIIPISWQTATKYSESYDQKPLIYNPAGDPLKGYFVDSAGFSLIQANPQIKGLYLRFGRKTDGAFTIMLLGTDSKNYLIKDSKTNGDANFDNTLPCPKECPPNETP